MRIVIPHHTDRINARRRIDARLQDLLGQHGHYLSDINQHWEGDRLVFSGSAKGFKANGSVEVTDTDVIIDGKLPLIAKPFESRIKGTIERDVEAKIPDKATPLVLYCGGGFRSALAADNLQKMGYTNIFSMDGGIRDWREKGYPLSSG